MRRRVLIDGRMAMSGGGYTHLVNVVPRLARARPEERFRVLVRNRRVAGALEGIPGVELEFVEDRGATARVAFTLLEAPRHARAWNADLFFSVSEYAPAAAPCPVVASFRNPNLFSRARWEWPAREWPRFLALQALGRVSARRCARILFVSEDSARWIGDAAGVPPERRVVVHHGIDAAVFSRASQAARRSPRPRPYILSIGSIYRYKNYLRLIEAYSLARSRNPGVPDLVIIGDDQDPEYRKRMERACRDRGLTEQVHLLGEVPYEDVPAYYAHAALFVFPSYLETFGHPLLEAMASGTPLVASDLPVCREVAGTAARYADPFRPARLAEVLEEVLSEPASREVLVKEGRERVKQFTWERSTERLLALFDALAPPR